MKRTLSALTIAALVCVPLLSPAVASAGAPMYPYRGHVQNIGWQTLTGDGQMAGTTGQSLRLEAVDFVYPGQETRGHVQDIGWQPWTASDSTRVGTVGQSKRLEAIQVRGTNGNRIECQAHVQNMGWLPRVKDGQVCGTIGLSLRAEAFRFFLVQD